MFKKSFLLVLVFISGFMHFEDVSAQTQDSLIVISRKAWTKKTTRRAKKSEKQFLKIREKYDGQLDTIYNVSLEFEIDSSASVIDNFLEEVGQTDESYNQLLFLNFFDDTYDKNKEASMNIKLERYSKAKRIYEDIRSIQERKLDMNHRNYTFNLANLANVYRLQKRYSKAEALYLEIQSILETVYGNTEVVGSTWTVLNQC
jgi:tetratricopeptide (TPR) repeat protein